MGQNMENWRRHDFVNKLGQEIDRNQWISFINDEKYWQIEKTRIGSYEISTEWIGIDGDAIYQTFVKRNGLLQDVHNSKTERQAIVVHKTVCEIVKSKK